MVVALAMSMTSPVRAQYAYGGYGPGMMGSGMMGQHDGSGNDGARHESPGMMGPGMMMGQGCWGPGCGMMGPGMMSGYGPGMMMQGHGPGSGPGTMRTRMVWPSDLNLSTDDVKNYLERWIAMKGNPRLKVGDVKEKDADTIEADIVTTDK